MSVLNDRSGSSRASEIAILRQPVVHPDRSVYGYAIRVNVLDGIGGMFPEPEVEHLVDIEYSRLDVALLAGDRPILLRATSRLLSGDLVAPDSPHGIVLEIPPALAQRDDATGLVSAARDRGLRIALANYRGTGPQDALLPPAEPCREKCQRHHSQNDCVRREQCEDGRLHGIVEKRNGARNR